MERSVLIYIADYKLIHSVKQQSYEDLEVYVAEVEADHTILLVLLQVDSDFIHMSNLAKMEAKRKVGNLDCT